VRPLAFVVNQILVMNPLAAPLWIAGLIAPFAVADLRRFRFIAVAFVVTAVLTIAGNGKDYYLAAAYPPLFVLGALVAERAIRSVALRAVYVAAIVALAAVIAPLALPILPPATLVAYERALHVAPQTKSAATPSRCRPRLPTCSGGTISYARWPRRGQRSR